MFQEPLGRVTSTWLTAPSVPSQGAALREHSWSCPHTRTVMCGHAPSVHRAVSLDGWASSSLSPAPVPHRFQEVLSLHYGSLLPPTLISGSFPLCPLKWKPSWVFRILRLRLHLHPCLVFSPHFSKYLLLIFGLFFFRLEVPSDSASAPQSLLSDLMAPCLPEPSSLSVPRPPLMHFTHWPPTPRLILASRTLISTPISLSDLLPSLELTQVCSSARCSAPNSWPSSYYFSPYV